MLIPKGARLMNHHDAPLWRVAGTATEAQPGHCTCCVGDLAPAKQLLLPSFSMIHMNDLITFWVCMPKRSEQIGDGLPGPDHGNDTSAPWQTTTTGIALCCRYARSSTVAINDCNAASHALVSRSEILKV